MSTHYPPIEIGKPGKAIAKNGVEFEFTPEILADIADSYDPTLFEAPLVIGHPTLNAPAWGSVGMATYDPQSQLVTATPSEVHPEFAEAVNQKLWRSVSMSIYLPNTPGNPKPGHHYLRHVGFLGAHPPAIKGLGALQFGQAEEGVLEFSDWQTFSVMRGLLGVIGRMRDWVLDERGQETADKLISRDDLDWLNRMVAEAEAQERFEDNAAINNFSQPEDKTVTTTAALDEREAKIAEREAALKKKEQEADRRHCLDFAEQLVQEGRILPRDKAGLAELLATLPADGPLEFGEGDEAVKTTSRAWLEKWTKSLPKAVDFSEWDQGDQGDEQPPNDQEIARRARSYKARQEEDGNHLSFAEAVDAVTKNLDIKR